MSAQPIETGGGHRPTVSLRSILEERPTIEYAGVEYAMARPDDLSPLRYERFLALWRRVVALSETKRARAVLSQPPLDKDGYELTGDDGEPLPQLTLEPGLLTFDEEDEWEAHMDELSELVLYGIPRALRADLAWPLLPRAVYEVLTPGQRYGVVTAFFQLVLARAGRALRPVPPVETDTVVQEATITHLPQKRTGSKSRRAANVSTGETPSDG